MPSIFIHEYLTSGACPDVPLDSSLMTEGKAMVDAVITDFAELEGVRVVTLRDQRLPAVDHPQVVTSPVSNPVEERSQFQNLCRSSERVLVIAPETDGILSQRVEQAREINPGGVFNCGSDTLHLGSDKWELFQRMQHWGISTIPTRLEGDRSDVWGSPVVQKPRDGAGCEGIRVIRNPAGLENADLSAVFQPLTPGVALSSAACFSSHGRRILTLPIGRQFVEIDDSIRYLGGQIPWQHLHQPEADRQAELIWQKLEQKLSGLQGYVGIDWLWDQEQQLLRLVEINPRLTTAYVGYREFFGTDIVAALRGVTPQTEISRTQPVRFTADGSIVSSPAAEALP